jgi:peptidoglycan/LPS O-acetylase OafA/YrhL
MHTPAELLGGTEGRKPLSFGWVGVDLFFVLSGFLITRILLSERDRPRYFQNFYARRMLRIWPLYYLTVMFAFVGVPLLPAAVHFDPGPHRWIYYATFTQNLFVTDQLGPWPIAMTWSLAIEEQFYIVWPLVVYFMRPAAMKAGLAALLVLVPAWRLWSLSHADTPLMVYISTLSRSDALAAGALTALIHTTTDTDNASRGRTLLFASGAALLIAAALIMGPLRGDEVVVAEQGVSVGTAACIVAVYSLLALGFSAGLLFSIRAPASRAARWLRNPILGSLGKVSYGLYLIHVAVFHLELAFLRPLWARHLGLRGLLLTCAGITGQLVLVLLLAVLSWKYFEQPILKLRHRFKS